MAIVVQSTPILPLPSVTQYRIDDPLRAAEVYSRAMSKGPTALVAAGPCCLRSGNGVLRLRPPVVDVDLVNQTREERVGSLLTDTKAHHLSSATHYFQVGAVNPAISVDVSCDDRPADSVTKA